MNMVSQAAAMAQAGTCAALPPGLQQYSDTILSWAKGSVLSLLGIGFFVSIVALIWGRTTHHQKGARLGFDGIMICVGAAILFAGGYVVITSIAGNGCS